MLHDVSIRNPTSKKPVQYFLIYFSSIEAKPNTVARWATSLQLPTKQTPVTFSTRNSSSIQPRVSDELRDRNAIPKPEPSS